MLVTGRRRAGGREALRRPPWHSQQHPGTIWHSQSHMGGATTTLLVTERNVVHLEGLRESRLFTGGEGKEDMTRDSWAGHQGFFLVNIHERSS